MQSGTVEVVLDGHISAHLQKLIDQLILSMFGSQMQRRITVVVALIYQLVEFRTLKSVMFR